MRSIHSTKSSCLLALAITIFAGLVDAARADNLRADQWQPLLYEPQSKQRTAVSHISVTFPNPIVYDHAMRDDDFGPRGFSDAPSAGGLNLDTRHYTTLGPHTISVVLYAFASQDPSQEPPESRPIGTATSTSTFLYNFRLMKDANVRLNASTERSSSGGGSSSAALLLDGPSGRVASLDGNDQVSDLFLTLPAGNYTIHGIATAQNGGVPLPAETKVASATIELELRQWPDFSPVEILDPVRSGWVTPREATRTATIDAVPPTRFWSGGVEAAGVAADGITPLLVRWRPESWAQVVTLRFPGISSGYLMSIDEWNDGPPYEQGFEFTPVVYESVNLPGYEHANRYVYAVYVPPVSFAEGGWPEHGRHKPRMTEIIGQGWLGGVPGQHEFTPLRIYRPPVILLHGLEDDRLSWQWLLRFDARFHVHVADYEPTNNVRFLQNIFTHQVVSKAVKKAKDMLLDEGIAVTQVDIFGHSMGGILARLWTLTDNMYVRAENLYRGDFHMLVTVNTPHRGSPISCLVVEQDGSLTPYGETFGPIADWYSDRCSPCGAVADLRPDSQALLDLNSGSPSVPVPVHAMFGIGGLQFAAKGEPDHEYVDRTVRWILGWCSSLTLQAFFASDADPAGDNDAVVSKVSQIHGLPDECTSQFEFAEGLHYPVISEVVEGTPNSWAIALLNSSVMDGDGRIVAPFADSFPHYPVRGACPPAAVACSRATPTSSGLAFSSPPPDSRFISGQTISISLTLSDPPPNPYLLYLIATGPGWNDAQVFLVPPPVLLLHIPSNFAGPLRLEAIVTGTPSNTFSAIGAVTVHVDPPSEPLDLRVTPEAIRLSQDAREDSVRVIGSFSDGVDRELTATVSVESADPLTARMTDAGTVQAYRVGKTSLLVSWGARQVTVPVTVESAPGDWNSDGQVNSADAVAFQAVFTGGVGTPGYHMPLAGAQFAFDFDGDNDVDCADWEQVVNRWTDSTPIPTLVECPTCIADFNRDGRANSADFFDYLVAFFSGALAADLNDDGQVTSQDLFDFLVAFFVAC